MFLPSLLLVLLLAYIMLGRGAVRNLLVAGRRGDSRDAALVETAPTAKKISILVIGILTACLSASLWFGAMFYADPGYNYQVRTITGNIVGYNSPGWKVRLFGDVVPWKKAMSVAHSDALSGDEGGMGDGVSADLPPHPIRMLDRVDGTIEQTTRFRLPDDIPTFLNMAEEYRTPLNLLRTELIPTVQQVITASSSLMSAEDYFNGKRNDFQMDFDYQMRSGIFLVDRREVVDRSSNRRKSTADASLKGDQEEFDDQVQTRFVVKKLTNDDGSYKTRAHNYKRFGITVVDAKITDFEPNDAFKRRMEQQQQASADRSIAREQRIQEEEQKQLAIVRGEREIAEEQARVLKSQIKRTTEAETEKSLALIDANKQLEQAVVDKETAIINLERDRTIAQSKQVLADADKYEREARIAGDNALQQRLDAEVKIQQAWADAYAKRAVPQQVFTSGGDGDTTVGGDAETQRFMQILTVDAAKRLSYDRSLEKPEAKK